MPRAAKQAGAAGSSELRAAKKCRHKMTAAEGKEEVTKRLLARWRQVIEMNPNLSKVGKQVERAGTEEEKDLIVEASHLIVEASLATVRNVTLATCVAGGTPLFSWLRGRTHCSRVAQIVPWRFGLWPRGSDCSLKIQIAARSQQIAAWRFRLQP